MDIIRRSIRRPFQRQKSSATQAITAPEIGNPLPNGQVLINKSNKKGNKVSKSSGKSSKNQLINNSISAALRFCQGDEIAVRSAVCKFRVTVN